MKAEAAALTMKRFFWCTRKKEIQDKTLFLLYFLPELLFVRVCRVNGSARMQAAVDNCPERMHLAALYRLSLETVDAL